MNPEGVSESELKELIAYLARQPISWPLGHNHPSLHLEPNSMKPISEAAIKYLIRESYVDASLAPHGIKGDGLQVKFTLSKKGAALFEDQYPEYKRVTFESASANARKDETS